MKRKPYGVLLILVSCAVVLFASTFVHAIPPNPPFSQYYDCPFSSELGKNAGPQQPGISPAKIGRITEGHNLIWGDSVGWVNLKATHAELKIGSNILEGWVWLENCGWVCLGEGYPLKVAHYSNQGSYDWGVNNNGQGKLSGFAWSEVTGWINFQTSHSRVYLDRTGQFYGYAWGENVGWMHFGPGRSVEYLAKADPGPWKEMEAESGGRLAGRSDDSAISSSSVPVTSLNSNYRRYTTDAWTVSVLRLERDDFCDHIRCSNTPIDISSLTKLSPIRAPPAIV
ncbi:MAG: hypothetical protein NTZ78_13305 [Candidatus Aureabacteria bacterium]|nr:hypothetical protein [Candidatus Auribacterota bacterium]